MAARHPTTVYLDPKVARAVKVKAALNGKSLSDLTNESLALMLERDRKLIRLAKSRLKQPARDYAEFLEELRAEGLI